MSHKVFLSHTTTDKPIVEKVALALENILGRDQVFYDAWSIKPGDGIIEQMNNGLESPEFVFFFVSEKSLNSPMVELEWQTALHAATKGKTRLIPVRIDDVVMPPLLISKLYLDLGANGLDTTTLQIIDIVQGLSSYTPQHEGFSNLTYSYQELEHDGSIQLEVKVSHFSEPNTTYFFLINNQENEVDAKFLTGNMIQSGFITLEYGNGTKINAIHINPMHVIATKDNPLSFYLSKKTDKPIKFEGIAYSKNQGRTYSIMQKSSLY